MQNRFGEARAVVALLAIFVITIGLALLISPASSDSGLEQFEDPEDPLNIAVFLGLILAFTFLILWIAKKKLKWVIRLLILGAVGSALLYVFLPILWQWVGLGINAGFFVALGLAFVATVALWKHPEWYVIDIVGVLVAAGAASIFGISLVPWLVIVFLVALAIYDAIAVYRTKHMLSLADTVIELRLPVLLVIPKVGGYHFKDDAARLKKATQTEKGERDAMFMGLGDLVMPTILVVSASKPDFGFDTWGWGPPIGAAVGTVVGYLALMVFVLRGNPQAGLPLLNGGAIAGFLVGLFVATGSLVFW